jgi:hypothetical protein
MSTPAAQTSIAALKTQAAPPDVQNLPQVNVGFSNLQSFELAQRAAKLLASSTLVPKEYQGNIPNCAIALNMAARIGADPLLVMQNLYNVHGRPGWSAQFTIACFNQCGRFSAIRYKWAGKEYTDDWSCTAYAVEKETGEVITGPVISIAMAKKEGWYQKNGSKWQTIPQLMLMYRAGAWLTRTHAPEITMGLQTQEELHDVYDARQDGAGRYAVDLESLQSAKPAAEASPPAVEWDAAAAIAEIKAATSVPALEQVMDAIEARAKAAGVDLGVELDGAYTDRKSVLEQKL